MKKKHTAQSAFLNLCILLGVFVFFAGILVALFAATDPQSFTRNGNARKRRSDGVPFAPAGEVFQAWVARYTPPWEADDDAKAIAVDTQGNVYVTGQSWGLGGNYDYATVKYNSAGQQEWATRYDGPDNRNDQANSMAIDSSGTLM